MLSGAEARSTVCADKYTHPPREVCVCVCLLCLTLFFLQRTHTYTPGYQELDIRLCHPTGSTEVAAVLRQYLQYKLLQMT